ncbi:hypothetical protein [Vibrio tapetis]|uniref:Cysteinyl-tRNA synthetase n=1 Tax=Vibrio tapetis subsp. tapetis TaxID=1671868 RepID=A0A2N8ZI81_9VIBR|nr:hypothetical protein [Vibrio tapetis]SON51622.1 Cysteinyl-tRNA synthetase [Vibrio tapetis subsp. tapetis]
MARSTVLQATIKGTLEQDFRQFQKRERLTDADAVRDLLSLALRIKLSDSEDDRPSNRELMEEIYRVVRSGSAINDVIHGQTFDGEKLYREQKESKPVRQQIKADIDNKVESYLAGEKKG